MYQSAPIPKDMSERAYTVWTTGAGTALPKLGEVTQKRVPSKLDHNMSVV